MIVQPWDDGCRSMKTPYRTPYRTINAKPRELCECKRGPIEPEYETCEHCYLDAQADVDEANVIDLDDERNIKAWGG